MKLDLATAYAASLARVGSWAIVAGLLFQHGNASQLAMLVLARGTVGLFSYASLGLAPVLINRLTRPIPVVSIPSDAELTYASRMSEAEREAPNRVYTNAWLMVIVGCVTALGLGLLYLNNLHLVHPDLAATRQLYSSVAWLVMLGVLVRTIGDVPGALLQARGRIARDNVSIILGEVVFVLGGLFVIASRHDQHEAEVAAMAFLAGTAVATVCRCLNTRGLMPLDLYAFDSRVALMLLFGGGWVVLGQLADWLYAPVNQILIERTISLTAVAYYAPAIQIDTAMLLLVGGLSMVLLPKSATAFANREYATVRQYYVRGTLVSLALLLVTAAVILLLDEWIFRLWFNNSMPLTQEILPLVLVHTVIGGTSGVGRAVLFGIGRIKSYAISAIVGGLANVVLAVVFATQTSMGLRGIIWATVITVTIRCAVWMPWYTLRALRQEAAAATPVAS